MSKYLLILGVSTYIRWKWLRISTVSTIRKDSYSQMQMNVRRKIKLLANILTFCNSKSDSIYPLAIKIFLNGAASQGWYWKCYM